MNRKIDRKKSILVLGVLLAVAIPLSSASNVTLTEGVVIEQPASNLNINVTQEFNVSTLTAYEDATSFGGTNFSAIHGGSQTAYAQMPFFDKNATRGEEVTKFDINATSGTSLDIVLSNLTSNRYYALKKDGSYIGQSANMSSGGDGSFSYSPTVESGYHTYTLEASVRDGISVNVNTNKAAASPNSSITVSGTATRNITGSSIENGDVNLYVDGNQLSTGGLTTDASGDFSYTYDTSKIAGEHTVEAVIQKNDVTGSSTADYDIDEIFLENANIDSVTGNNVVDIDNTPNATVKVYRNNQNPIDAVRYRVDKFTLEFQGELNNVSPRTQTQTYYKELQDLDLSDEGSYSIEYRAESTLNGQTIYAKENLSADFEVQNISVPVDTGQESYGKSSGDMVSITGEATKRTSETNTVNVTGETVNIDIINKSSGQVIDSLTTTTDSNGQFSKGYSFVSEEGVRIVEAEVNNSDGIHGIGETEFSVTDMNIDSHSFIDSTDVHGYKVQIDASDSEQAITDQYECRVNAADGEGNTEQYQMDLNTSFDGNDNTARCTSPVIAASNNSGWDHLEQLETTAEFIDPDGVTATSIKSEKLPNNAPDVKNISIDLDLQGDYRFTISSVASDGDIPGENEITGCTVDYYDSQNNQYSASGNLDKTFGDSETARCTLTKKDTNSPIVENEVLDAEVTFTDAHGASAQSARVDSSAPFEVSFEDAGGTKIDTNLVFKDSNTGETVKTLSDANGEFYEPIPEGEYDIDIEAFGKTLRLLDTTINSHEKETVELDDDLTEAASISKSQVTSQLDRMAVSGIGLSYSSAQLVFEYPAEEEQTVSPWRCGIQDFSLPISCEGSYELASGYDIDTDNDELIFDSGNAKGVYTTASSGGWKEGWATRSVFEINGTESQDLQDYQVELEVDTRSLIRDNKLKDSCGDMRFYDSAQEKRLDHWLKPGECGDNDTEVWVNVPNIPANSSRLIYMYTGNDSLGSVSSGPATFLEFDEFYSGEPGSDYLTSGNVPSSNSDEIVLRSSDGQASSVVYDTETRSPPYRFFAKADYEDASENSRVGTFSQGSSLESDSIFLDLNQDIYNNTYSGDESALSSSSATVDISQNITSDSQEVNVEPDDVSTSLTGTVSGSEYPFSASLKEDSGVASTFRVDRWYTAKLADQSPEVNKVESGNDQWELYLNDKDQDISISKQTPFDVKANSSSQKNSDVEIYLNDQLEATSQDTTSASFEENVSENRYYEVRAYISRIDQNLIKDVIVGNDDEAPIVSDLSVSQDGEDIALNYEVTDNYLGDVECEALVNGVSRKQERVEITSSLVNVSSSFALTNIPSGEVQLGVKCSDQSGNEDQEQLPATTDFEAPDINVTKPEDGASQIRVRPEIEMKLTDETTQDINYTVSYQDSSITKEGQLANDTLETFRMKAPDTYGDKTLVITATDKNGFESLPEYVNLNLQEPEVTITSPSQNLDSSPLRTIYATNTYSPDPGDDYTVTITRGEDRRIYADRYPVDEQNPTFEFDYETEATESTQCELLIDGQTKDTITAQVNQTESVTVPSIDQGINRTLKVECDTAAGTELLDKDIVDVDREKPSLDRVRTKFDNKTEYKPNKQIEVTAFVSDNLQEPSTGQTDSFPYLQINGSDGQIMMESNFSGSLQNRTVACNEQSYNWGEWPEPKAKMCDDTHTAELGNVAAGEYSYRFFIKDQTGNTRITENRTYKILPGIPGLSWDITNERAKDGDIVRGTSTGLKCSVSNQDAELTLERNGTQVDTSTSGPVSDNEVLNTPDTYTYNCSVPATNDYNASNITLDFEVLDEKEDGINLSLSSQDTTNSPPQSFKEGTSEIVEETDSDWTITYGEAQETIETSARSGNANLTIDGADVSETYSKSFTPGNYLIKSNSTGSSRFTPSSINKTLNVEKSTPNLDLYTNPSYIEVDETFDLICDSSTSQSELKLYFNNTLQNSGTTDYISTTIDASDYGQGTYDIGCKSVESENYTSADIGNGPGISNESGDGDSRINPNSATINFDFTPSSEIQSSGNDDHAVEIGTEVTVTCNTVEENVSTTLKEDGTVANAPYTTTYTSIGDHNFVCTSEETSTYEPGREEKELSVQAKTDSTLLIDGSAQDVTVTQNDAPDVNITALLNVSEDIELQRLNTPVPDDYSGAYPQDQSSNGEILDSSSVLTKDDPSNVVPGTYTFRAVHEATDNGNYFGSTSASHDVNVQDVYAPRMSLSGIEDSEQLSTQQPTVKIRTEDYSGYQCSISVDGQTRDIYEKKQGGFGGYSGPKSVWSEGDNNKLDDDSAGSIGKMNETTLSNGLHTLKASCTDDSGNTRSITRSFIIDTAPPEVSISDGSSGFIQYETSSPNVSVTASDNPRGAVDVVIKDDDTGDRLGSKDNIDGSFDIGIKPLAPGQYNIRATGEDEAGNTADSSVKTMDIPAGIYNMSPASFADNDGTTYVNSQDVNLSYQYGSDAAPLEGCTVGVDESGGLTQTYDQGQVTNNTVDTVEVNSLGNGEVNWNVSCGSGDNELFQETSFIVDVEDPFIEDTWVSRSSGNIFDNTTTTFEVTASDNFDVSEANISASWLSTHNMECDDSGTCVYQTVVPPGDHEYNFTVCDEAGNCETTSSKNYDVISTDDTFQLQLNDAVQNVTLRTTPTLNISGAIEGSERANMYFDINDSAIAQSLDSTGVEFQEKFFANGTYNVSATFQSTESSRQDTDWLLVDVNITDDVIAQFGYNIFGIPEGKNASLRNDPRVSPTVPRFGVSKRKKIILGEGLGQNLAAQLNVDFTDDLDASDISFAQSKSERKAVISFTRNYNKIQDHSLLVPRQVNSGEVVVCPRADTLSEVQIGCTDGVNVSAGETVNGISNTETIINGEKYYHITGISGTGAQELQGEDTLEQDPAGANTTEIKTLNEYVDLSEDDSLDVIGGNVTGANISGDQTTDDWAGIYGNATGTINLGTDAILYTWPAEPQHVFAANDSVNWTQLQNASLPNINSIYQLSGQTDDAQATFNKSTTLYFGSTNISASAARTYNASENPTWITAATSDGSTPVFTGKVRNNATTSFNGEISDYQMIIPTGGGGDELIAYSMFIDLS
jgi:hypothetical protein